MLKKFEEYLARNGLRLTVQRQQVVKAFIRQKTHINAEELYRQVRKESPEIGYTTVYRTLKLLAEAGLAEARNFRDGCSRFESTHQSCHHDHLICRACGKVVEFTNNHIETLQEEVAIIHGFTISDHTLDIYGYCRDCRK